MEMVDGNEWGRFGKTFKRGDGRKKELVQR
jgi:hypothetical protein